MQQQGGDRFVVGHGIVVVDRAQLIVDRNATNSIRVGALLLYCRSDRLGFDEHAFDGVVHGAQMHLEGGGIRKAERRFTSFADVDEFLTRAGAIGSGVVVGGGRMQAQVYLTAEVVPGAPRAVAGALLQIDQLPFEDGHLERSLGSKRLAPVDQHLEINYKQNVYNL